MIYIFLERKTENTYTRMFSAIISSPGKYDKILEPRNIQIDFEVETFNAIKRALPMASISGCLFHFG